MKKQIVFIAISLLLLSGCQLSKVKTIKLAHGLDVTHSVHLALEFFGEEIHRISEGQLAVEVYPNSQLGSEREILELIQIGSLHMTKVSAATLENFAPKSKVLGLPYLFKNRAHAFRVLDGEIGQNLLEDSQRYRLKGLGYYDAGYRSFYTKERPVDHPDELKGLKIRVMESVTAMNMVRSFGGAPTPISWGELYTSLQQGVVDGAENNPPSFYLSKHYEICKYYSLNEHTYSPDVIIIGNSFWNQLNEEQQLWMSKAVNASIDFQRKLWAEHEANALEEVVKAGVEIVYPEKDVFMELAQKVHEQYLQDEELKSIITQIKALE
jgi:tripartite ATP-independent transporter DctP family solute receptor